MMLSLALDITSAESEEQKPQSLVVFFSFHVEPEGDVTMVRVCLAIPHNPLFFSQVGSIFSPRGPEPSAHSLLRDPGLARGNK